MEGFPVDFASQALERGWKEALDKLLRSKGEISTTRTRKIRYSILAIGRKLGKLPSDVTQEDLKEFFAWLDNEGYKSWTKHDYRLFTKELFSILKGKRFAKWIRVASSIESTIGPEDLVSRPELDLMRQKGDAQDKAILITLDGTGFMPAEFLSLKIKNVTFDEYGALIHLGKSVKGHLTRTVRIVEDYSDLADWVMRIHPLRDDPEAPLWINQSTNGKNQALKYQGLCRRLKKLTTDAQIHKRIYPYLFRHTRNTDWANRLTEAQHKQYAGWRQDSKAPRTYIHMASERVDETLLKSYGILKTEKKVEERLPRKCVRCGIMCAHDESLCHNCGMALTLEAAVQKDEENKGVLNRISKLEQTSALQTRLMILIASGQIVVGKPIDFSKLTVEDRAAFEAIMVPLRVS